MRRLFHAMTSMALVFLLASVADAAPRRTPAPPPAPVPAGPPPPVFGLRLGEPLNLPECSKNPSGSYKIMGDTEMCWRAAPPNVGDQAFFDITLGPVIQSQAHFASWEIHVVVIDGKLASIVIPTHGADWQQEVMTALTSKFGQPTELNDRYSAARRRWMVGEYAAWSRPGYRVEYRSITESLSVGRIEISTDAYRARMQALQTPQGL